MEVICEHCGNSQKYNKEFPNLTQIKYLREKLKISQSELARNIGIHQQAISRIESGIGDTSYSKAKKIFTFLFTEKQNLI